MPQTRLPVRNILEILRLRYCERRSLRAIGRSIGRSPSVAHDCLVRFRASGMTWPLPADIGDAELERRMYAPEPERPGKPVKVYAQPDLDYVHRELRRRHMTLYLLWQEYKLAHPEDGYQYSKFCQLYRQWAAPLDAVLRQTHLAGDKAFVDWSGDGIEVVDRDTGEVTEYPLFVGVLGASSYTFAKAAPSREGMHWIRMHIEMLEYFGGVPAATVPDNEKTGVTSPCRYDPVLNPNYTAWASHYNTTVLPARPGKARDKALVENAVLNAQRWILAALRNHVFFSLDEANAAIAEKLVEYNGRKFQLLDTTRRALFLELDRPALRPLPPRRYEPFDWKKLKLNIDYHVVVEKHHYSVPYRLIGKQLEARWTGSTVEIFCNGQRVASHARSFMKWGWTTDPAHRPPKHRAHLEWTPERLVAWARKTGPNAATLVEQILSSHQHVERGYKACLGVMRLGKTYGEARLEAACGRALALASPAYRTVAAILKSGADRRPPITNPQPELPLPWHENVRGPEYYQ